MTITAGTLSQLSVGATVASLSATAATGGTAPYTYQWYRSTTTGFTPGGGNIISGATALSLNDSGLIPNTIYYYKVIATDAVAATVTYTQLAVTTTASTLSQNQFAQSPTVGMIDMRMDYDTTACQVDVSQATALYAGSAVKVVDSSDGVPKVVACTAASDIVWGYINFDVKTVSYVAGSMCEVSQSGNIVYLYSVGAIARGAQVQSDVVSPGSVKTITGSSGANVVGYAFDKATAAGQLIRVRLSCPSYTLA